MAGGGLQRLNVAEQNLYTNTCIDRSTKKKVTDNTPCTCKLSVALDGCVKQSLQSVIVAVKLLHKHLYRQESKTKVEYLFYTKFFIKEEE